MAYEYNPLSGQFDIVGGTAVISAAVATPADLPITLGTPAVGVTYLAQSASGTWFVNYRPAGLYRRTANLGAAADWQYLGAFPEANRDDRFRVYNSADTTKQAAFDVSAIATGTTRTYTLPDASGTVMLGSLNLASLTNTATARTNIGLGSGDSPTFTNLTLTRGTITTSSPVAITQTWNAGAVTFTGLDVNVTNTASAAASVFADFRLGGTRQLAIGRAGELQWNTGSTPALVPVSSGFVFRLFTGSNMVAFGNPYVALTNVAYFGFSSVGDANNTANHDTRLYRDAAATLAQYNSTNAQTFRLYGTRTDASNGRWLAISSTTAGVFSITPTGNGTGASGNVLHISGLPTSNPGPGILWNNAGSVAIGT